MQHGIRSVTMDEIAAESGISKRTLYEMFVNKEDLLEKLLEFVWTEHRHAIENIIENTPSCIIGILNVLKYSIEAHRHKYEPKREYFFNDLRKIYPNLAEKSKQYSEGYLTFMAKHLEKGVEQKTVRNDLNLELASTLLIAQIEGLNSIKSIRQFHPNEIFSTLFLSFCRGISTKKGLREIEQFEKENQMFLHKYDKKMDYIKSINSD
jgi:AcrR family transcriptional regulator